LYAQGQAMEGSNLRAALNLYRDAAKQGNGLAAKRLWELLKDKDATASEAARYQRQAWDLKVPGVPEPKGPVRL